MWVPVDFCLLIIVRTTHATSRFAGKICLIVRYGHTESQGYLEPNGCVSRQIRGRTNKRTRVK